MNQTLYEQFSKIIKTNNERAAKDFLIEHLQEFPEDIQDKIAVAFFEDALDTQTREAKSTAALQQEVLTALEETQKNIKAVTDKKKELESKEALGL